MSLRASSDVSWEFVGGFLERLRGILGASGILLRPLGGHLGVSWEPLGSLLGPILAPLGALLGALGALWGPSWRRSIKEEGIPQFAPPHSGAPNIAS